MATVRHARGPGRVNLIGDHTDYNRGLALPMAIGLGVEVAFAPSDRPDLAVTSDAFGPGAELPVDLAPDPAAIRELQPAWIRLTAAMVALARPASGGTLRITATLPVGSGLSSSAALSVALAEVFGVTGSPEVIAGLCRQAEHLVGVPVGAMDPLVCSGGRRGHALLIDFATLSLEPVPIPGDLEVVVVDSGERRALARSGYAARVAECEAAAALIGPLGAAGDDDLAGLRDPLLRRRARHVVTECRRVRACASSLRADDPVGAGALMLESHRSLAGDFEVSTPALDGLVADLASRPGVFGARMTGAGFGGCVVALGRPGALDPAGLGARAWRVEASDGTVAAREAAPGRTASRMSGWSRTQV